MKVASPDACGKLTDELSPRWTYACRRSVQLSRAFRDQVRNAKFTGDELPARANISLGEFFHRVWPTIRAKRRYKGRTVTLWNTVWNAHLCHPSYGIAGHTMRSLAHSPELLDQFIVDMTEAGVHEPMQARVFSVLNRIFVEAARQSALTGVRANPIKELEGKPASNRKRDPVILPVEAIELLRQEILNHPNPRRRKELNMRDGLMISMLAYSAPRPEDLCNLDWEYSGTASGWVTYHAEKAQRGQASVVVREAPLAKPVREELEAWGTQLGNPGDDTPIIPLPAWGERRGGERWRPEDWKDWRDRVFRPALKRLVARKPELAYMAELSPYDLRHTAISLWLAHGGEDGGPANPVEVAQWAGHSAATMWSHYAHVIQGARREAKSTIDEQIRQARKKINATA
ncbi:hypothetical protein LCGC14_2313380 [marine sediment metagenome]|uniref:Tyr recombinase domain-containing protein n=1 Tax=marine sediment metagenome TaxID=412755 RepID=A0A0F9EXE1_9ZZZZ